MRYRHSIRGHYAPGRGMVSSVASFLWIAAARRRPPKAGKLSREHRRGPRPMPARRNAGKTGVNPECLW